jgi:hypothetical protein
MVVHVWDHTMQVQVLKVGPLTQGLQVSAQGLGCSKYRQGQT